MNFGLSQNTINIIISTLSQYREIKRAVIFGSRSMGNYKNGSDIDIAVFGEDITQEIVNKISIELNENKPLPYYFDIIHYNTIKNNELLEHINNYSKLLYEI